MTLRTRGLLALMRPVNTLVAFIAIAAAAVIAGAEWSDRGRVLLAATAGALLAAAGNIINDVFDIAIDRINKPRRAIVRGIVPPRTARIWAALCAATGIALSLPLGIVPASIAMASAALLYFYSARLKGIPLIGNIAVGLLTGMAFIFGASVFGHPAAGVVPGLFAFFFNLAREMLKDLEDRPGDQLAAVRTFPLIAGERWTLRVVTILLVTVILGSIIPYWLSLYNEQYFWVVFFGVDCVLAVLLVAMWNDRSRGNIARLNVLLKYDMLLGITAIVMGAR
ncbi:MAG: geranylgeranylglycerol-phosphate geranylgeranyltransferase [Bacteroidota bacterium]|nr:geranylgeranylglycerol-phosphate geranylgeranyltransferase [Bacteroidota bacterium]